MMHETQRLKGWKMLAYALFLGPLFLVLYFRETRNAYPAAKYFAWLSLLAMALCAYLMFAFTFSPFIIRIVYLIIFLAIFGLAFFYCWGLDSKAKARTPKPKQKYSFSRACAWMMVMGVLFTGLNNVVQALYYWILGEQVSVYFSSQANTFQFWGFVGLVYGFVYGIQKNNDYFDRDLGAVAKSILSVFVFMFLYSGSVLALVIYPLQRLAPISYYPQLAEFVFYEMFFIAICLSAIYLLRTAIQLRTLKTGLMFFVGIPLIALHVMVVSAYAVTINLAIASILEDKQKHASAKTLYARAIPYIRHDNLLASLHHRQGVLHVLNQDYGSAIFQFKKVVADYSENYAVFKKARKYIDAFEENQTSKEHGRKVLVVRHRTFEQAASCFPNSLSVILNFYEKQPISTRKLSYAIKESFAAGTFIWKAESFLDKNGYELLTTFWQSKETLVALLEAGYPVLVYIPGHVYTLYGYDSRMEMFFTYDTAKSNRWNDKPFWTLQRDWMGSSFLMSVVVPKAEKEQFAALFPELGRYRHLYQLWQKVHISDYYENKGSYWRDYDRYDLSKSFGLDRLKMNEPYFLHDDFSPFPWDAEKWNTDVLPVLSQPWSLEWPIVETYILYLLYSGQSEQALQLIELYQPRLSEDPSSSFSQRLELQPRFSEGSRSSFLALLELKLATVVDAENKEGVLSASDKLIGITDNMQSGSYWGHYFKARSLMASGNLKGATELLLSALDNLSLGLRSRSKSFRCIIDALNEICLIDPSLIGPDKMALIEVARIDLAADR
jgi:hypothetical protein